VEGLEVESTRTPWTTGGLHRDSTRISRGVINTAHDTIIASHVFQQHYANTHRCQEPTIKQGDLIYLATKNLLLLKG
jgi:hypothetical protein